jgi:uncharacterized protein
MELALQVVGLKMTGKIEDAKNVAMRIVGTTSEPESSNGGHSDNVMELSSIPFIHDVRPVLLRRARGDQDFESLIFDFLSVLDIPGPKPSGVSMSEAVSLQTTCGQTLLHLASFLGFDHLVQWLIDHDVDLDSRDRNGWTPLHFASSAKMITCARALIQAGADVEIVNARGETPADIAPDGFFGDISGDELADDEDTSQWDDVDADEEDETMFISARPRSRRSLPELKIEHSDHEQPPELLANNEKSVSPGVVDGKEAASFIDMIHRTLAQLYAPQTIISNIPQLHLPLPQLSDLPAVPWGSLPQIPMVFPIFVASPGWPSFKRGDNDTSDVPQYIGAGAIRSAQDTWEKWVAIATRQQHQRPPSQMGQDESPLVSPSHEYDGDGEDETESLTSAARPLPSTERTVARKFDYGSVPVPDQEVHAYAYRPAKNKNQKLQKKRECGPLLSYKEANEDLVDDRMLILFWIPILMSE